MRVVAVLAVAGLIALVVALLTGSTWAAVAVIALAVAGIALLLRDWREIGNVPSDSRQPPHEEPVIEECELSLTADEFSPDLSTDPDGPSSDARADQF
jgi:hypothetical protein